MVRIPTLSAQQVLPSATVVNASALLCGCLFCDKHVDLCFINTNNDQTINTMVTDTGPSQRQHVTWSLPAFIVVVHVRCRPSSVLSVCVSVHICCQQYRLVSAYSSCHRPLCLGPTPLISTSRSAPQHYALMWSRSSVNCAKRLRNKRL